MGIQITCCITNLQRHQYGDKLNELAAEGVDIQIERCLSMCAGCSRQPSFMAEGKWHGVDNKEDFKKTVYANAGQIG